MILLAATWHIDYMGAAGTPPRKVHMMYLLNVCGTDNMVNLIGSIVGTGVATMVLLLALFYMAAQFFRKPEYEAFVSIEVHQLIASLIIFALIFGTSCFADEMVKSIVGGGKDAFDVGASYLQYITNDIALSAVEKLQGLLLLSQWASSMSMRFGASVWGVAIPIFPAFAVIERTVEFLLMLITPFLSSLIVQQVGLQVIRGTMLPFVLPMGVVLRIFPPTRDAGSFLISTAIAFQIVFPFTYVMHDKLVREVLIPAAYSDQKTFDKALQDHNSPNLASYIGEYGLFDIDNMFFKPLLGISFLLLQALFLPALSITLTVAFIKGFNKFITQKMG